MSDSSLLTAAHEAGHAAAWLLAGRRVQSVRIDEHGAGGVRPLARWSRDALLLARAALAGPAAEAKHRGVPLVEVLTEDDSARDYDDACRYLGAPAVPTSLIAEAELMIATNWRLVWILTTQLQAHRKLGFRRLEALRRAHVAGQAWL